MTEELIAPCGMNCNICMAYLRKKDRCLGCNIDDSTKSKSRANCKIKNCVKREGKYCFDCKDFPCEKLSHLDKRYRSKYNMSEIENLKKIKNDGMEKFIESEQEKWQCPKCGHLRSCHNELCYNCDIGK